MRGTIRQQFGVLLQKISVVNITRYGSYPVSLTSKHAVSMPAWRAKNGSDVANAAECIADRHEISHTHVAGIS